jgi:hypothetical protein
LSSEGVPRKYSSSSNKELRFDSREVKDASETVSLFTIDCSVQATCKYILRRRKLTTWISRRYY